MAALDCQLFDYENQVGTEYLFGTVLCPGLVEKLAQGQAIISDEREGLNPRNTYVQAFSRAVSRLIGPHVLAAQEKLRHLARATTSGRTAHMIERLLQRMSRAAIQDLDIAPPSAKEPMEGPAALAPPLRFTTPLLLPQAGPPLPCGPDGGCRPAARGHGAGHRLRAARFSEHRRRS